MKTIADITFDNKEKAITEASHDLLIIKNVNINATETNAAATTSLYGADIRRCTLVEIENVAIKAVNILRKYAYGLRLGYANTPADANKLVKIKSSSITGFGPASSDYNTANRDGIALEGGELWLKDTIISNVSDACIDCKGSVKALNCTFEKGYRDIRIWGGQTATLVNCKVGTVWMKDATSTLILFNTPMPTIETDTGAGVVKTVTVNPLTDPWFGDAVVTPPVVTPPGNAMAALKLVQRKRVEFEQAQLAFLETL